MASLAGRLGGTPLAGVVQAAYGKVTQSNVAGVAGSVLHNFVDGGDQESGPVVPLVKEEEVVCGASFEDSPAYQKAGPDSATVQELQVELATSYYWSGSFWKDLVFFWCNWHPVLGMFCSHPLHPWSKSERIATFFVSCSLTALPAALIVTYSHNGSKEVQQVAPMFVFMFITLPVMVLEIALYWVAIIDIYFRGGGCIKTMAVYCVAGIRKMCFLWSLALSSFMLFLSYLALTSHRPKLDPVEMLEPFVMSRIQSWVLWFPLWFFLPCVGFLWVWCGEKDAKKQDGLLETDTEEESSS